MLNNATWAMLNETEKALLREAEPSALSRLDEDELIDLHARVRRARTKYATLYRRRAGSQVRKDTDRAKAHAQHARTAAKAEAFEDALARVSRALAKAARESAAALRAERLAAVKRQPKPAPRQSRRRTATPGSARTGAKRTRTPITKRASASARAATRRSEAKRDSR